MKNLFFGILLCSSFSILAQRDNASTKYDTITKTYGTWSVEVNVGQNKALEPFTPKYYQAGNTNYFNFSTVNSFNIGVRKMFSTKFGLKFNVAYNSFSNGAGTTSLPFQTKLVRTSLEGVVNLGRVFEFESFSKRLGLLGHAGVQVSNFSPGDDIKLFQRRSGAEDNGGLLLGITPQFKLTNGVVFTADVSYVFNVRQHYTWDGQSNSLDAVYNTNNTSNLSGSMLETTIGFTFYVGKKEKHADWYLITDKMKDLAGHDDIARFKIAKIEKMLEDTDRDGVPDYRDSENNTPAGITVDAKGRFIDINKNGVPDDMERGFRDGTDGSDGIADATKNDVLKSLVQKGYVNIFFDVNMDSPNKGSTSSVFQIIEYLRTHPDAKAILKGYADVRGSEVKNLELSKRRAQKFFDIINASGIAASRITIAGQGVDATYPNTEVGRDLARRVSVTIK